MLERYLDSLTSYAESTDGHETVTESLPATDIGLSAIPERTDEERTAGEGVSNQFIAVAADLNAGIEGYVSYRAEEPERKGALQAAISKERATLLTSAGRDTSHADYKTPSRPLMPFLEQVSNDTTEDGPDMLSSKPIMTFVKQASNDSTEAAPDLQLMAGSRYYSAWDCPVPDIVLRKCGRARISQKGEFTHVTVSALSWAPVILRTAGFKMRPQLFAERRNIELVISLDLNELSMHEFSTQWRALQREVIALQGTEDFRARCSGGWAWKGIVVCIHVKGVTLEKGIFSNVLENMGILNDYASKHSTKFVNADGSLVATLGKNETVPVFQNGHPVLCMLH